MTAPLARPDVEGLADARDRLSIEVSLHEPDGSAFDQFPADILALLNGYDAILTSLRAVEGERGRLLDDLAAAREWMDGAIHGGATFKHGAALVFGEHLLERMDATLMGQPPAPPDAAAERDQLRAQLDECQRQFTGRPVRDLAPLKTTVPPDAAAVDASCREAADHAAKAEAATQPPAKAGATGEGDSDARGDDTRRSVLHDLHSGG